VQGKRFTISVGGFHTNVNALCALLGEPSGELPESDFGIGEYICILFSVFQCNGLITIV
jgi:hypothetical protein